MPILDGFPAKTSDALEFARLGSAFFEREAARQGLSPRAESVVELLKEGLSLADILRISPEERDAVLVMACRHLQRNDAAAAKALLIQLVMLEPMDQRALYALALAHQVLGEAVLAGKLYLYTIALDATDPEPYLRLGECFLADRDIEGARGCFEGAKILARGRPGADAQIAHADRMLATLPPPSEAGASPRRIPR